VRVVPDTNVVLDLLLARPPFADAAAELIARIERGEIEGCLGAGTITTTQYLARKVLGDRRARQAVADLLALFEIVPFTRAVLQEALVLPFAAFEDAVLHEAARFGGADAVVTRNLGDFRAATLPVYSPADLLSTLDAAER
jgi:predicted nucleic acid-binding protein